jgi:hypothetical protein
MMVCVRIYESWQQETAQLTHEEKGRLVDSLVEFALTGEEKQPEGNEKYIYPMMAQRIRQEKETHERRIAESKLQKALAGGRNL